MISNKGDPLKAVKAMINFTQMDSPSLCMPMGNIALDAILLKFTNQLEEFKQYESLARSTDFDE